MLRSLPGIVCLLLVCCFCKAQPDSNPCRQVFHDGYDYLFSFKAEEALERFRKATACAITQHDDHLLGMSLAGVGQALWYLGDFDNAIDTVTLSLEYLKKKNNEPWFVASTLRILSNIYDQAGRYDKAFEAISSALEICNADCESCKEICDPQNLVLSFIQIGSLYRNIGDYATSLDYYQRAEQLHPEKKGYPYRELNAQIGKLYVARQLFDSAHYYFRNALPGHPSPKNVYALIGDCYLAQKKPDSAYQYFIKVYRDTSIFRDVNINMYAMIGLGRIYLDRKETDSAFFMAREALEIATRKGTRQNKRDALLLLSSIYENKQDVINAMRYYKHYVAMKDSVISEQFKGQLYSFKLKENNAKHDAELRSLRNQKRSLAAGIIAVFVLGIFIILAIVLRHNNERLRYKQRSAELEMQALRAQMNPHFIFNCLSAINHFILNKETDIASHYLTRFSRLIRLVLVNSEKTVVSLEEELSMLRFYLDMEQLRFKDAFDYHIHYDAGIQASMIMVPSFILQPFCENAIWHGLLHKKGKGELNIDFMLKGGWLICTITDNGVGMVEAAKMKTQLAGKQASFGHKLAIERLLLFNNEGGVNDPVLVENITNETGEVTGTKVILRIKNNPVHD